MKYPITARNELDIFTGFTVGKSGFQPIRETGYHAGDVLIIPKAGGLTSLPPDNSSKTSPWLQNGGAAEGARREKQQMKEFYFYLSRALYILQTHEVKPAWPVSTHSHTQLKQQMKQTDSSSQSFSSHHLVCILKSSSKLASLSWINEGKSGEENDCFPLTSLWLWDLMDRNVHPQIRGIIPVIMSDITDYSLLPEWVYLLKSTTTAHISVSEHVSNKTHFSCRKHQTPVVVWADENTLLCFCIPTENTRFDSSENLQMNLFYLPINISTCAKGDM